MYFSNKSLELALAVVEGAVAKGLLIATAESCTGGLIAACLTDIAGASRVFERGFVTYANEAKVDLLGVTEETLATQGAVSEDVARAMAEGLLGRTNANIGVSTTGIAGPDGGTETKPVGLVHLAAALRGNPTLHRREVFSGTREDIRQQAVETALALVLEQVETAPAQT